MNFFKRFFTWLKIHPFFFSTVLLLILIVPGFIRIEMIADNARSTAKAVAKAEANESFQICITRNTFQANSRNRFVQFNDALEAAFVASQPTPQRAEELARFVSRLRKAVEADPSIEDRDCNGDKKLDHIDYFP